MPKYKATAYIRLSYTDDRSSESDSVANQRKLIENFVERNPDIEVISEKIDDGYSGIIFDRPAFKEMMQDVTDGVINCVIVKDLSRLGREYIETGATCAGCSRPTGCASSPSRIISTPPMRTAATIWPCR
ncbi:Resolvase, N terminal domain [Oscillibacter sp. PC13]|nr:Resolvase, N terminal domain [Oscillibacter sp. PC13]